MKSIQETSFHFNLSENRIRIRNTLPIVFASGHQCPAVFYSDSSRLPEWLILPEKSTNQDLEFLLQLVNLIEINLSNADYAVRTLCREMAMSQSNLLRKLKQLTGLSIKDCMALARLHKAMALLMQDKTRQVCDIAFECGYNDADYFTRAFSRHTGVPPTRWRTICTGL